jgi:ketosteroid isomerase-like protein
MRVNQRLLIEAAYASWDEEDLSLLGSVLHANAVSHIRLPPGAWPMSGILRGKRAILDGLGSVAKNFEVAEYRPITMRGNDGVWTCRARVQYAHRQSGLVYQATNTNVWTIIGDKITGYDSIHDAELLRTFFQLVSRLKEEV